MEISKWRGALWLVCSALALMQVYLIRTRLCWRHWTLDRGTCRRPPGDPDKQPVVVCVAWVCLFGSAGLFPVNSPADYWLLINRMIQFKTLQIEPQRHVTSQQIVNVSKGWWQFSLLNDDCIIELFLTSTAVEWTFPWKHLDLISQVMSRSQLMSHMMLRVNVVVLAACMRRWQRAWLSWFIKMPDTGWIQMLLPSAVCLLVKGGGGAIDSTVIALNKH